MAICVSPNGVVLEVDTTPIGQCTSYVLVTATEYSQINPPLSVADTSEIAFGVVSVWAVIWAIKTIRRAL